MSPQPHENQYVFIKEHEYNEKLENLTQVH